MTTKAKKYIKYDVHGNLFGSLRYDLSPAEMSIWDRMLALAKLSSYEGIILRKEWTDDAIVAVFNLAPYGGIGLFKGTIDKLVKTERVQIMDDGSYNIINWHKYQDTPAWVTKMQESVRRNAAINKARADKPQVLEPSAELKATADKIDNAAKVIKQTVGE